MKNQWAFLSGASLLVIISATILAYLRLIPTELKSIPYYDTIGHFVLFGSLAFCLDRMFKNKNLRIGVISLPLAGVFVTFYAAGDELLQGLSSARSLDITDFIAGFVGIVSFVALSRLILSHPSA